MSRFGDDFYESVLKAPLGRVFAWVQGPILWAVIWVVVILSAFYWWNGKEALLAPLPLGLAAAGAVVALAAGGWWTSRIRPLIVVAKFETIGSLASGEADGIRDRIVDALREQAEGVGERQRWIVRTLTHVVDPGDPREYVKGAKSQRAPVLVAGKLRVDPGQWVCTVQIITPVEQLEWRPDQSKPVRIELPTALLEKQGEGKRLEITAITVATATLALGLAFLAKGNYQQAYVLLRRESGSLALFYAGLAAFMMEDFTAALGSAQSSWSVEPFRPTGALSAAAAYQLGQADLGLEWIARRNQQPAVTGEWAQLVADLEPLSTGHGVAAVLINMQEKIDENQKTVDRAIEQFMRTDEVNTRSEDAYQAMNEGDYERILSLTPSPGPDEPRTLAAFAAAAAHLGRDNAPELAQAAEEAVAADSDHDGLAYLVETYAALGAPESFARPWEQLLARDFRKSAALAVARVSWAKIKFVEVVSSGFWEHPDVAKVTHKYLSLAGDEEEDPERDAQNNDGATDPA